MQDVSPTLPCVVYQFVVKTNRLDFQPRSINEEEAHSAADSKNYYSIAHCYKEDIHEQPTILTGGTLKEYQVQGSSYLWALALSASNTINDVLLNSPKWVFMFSSKLFERILLFILDSLQCFNEFRTIFSLPMNLPAGAEGVKCQKILFCGFVVQTSKAFFQVWVQSYLKPSKITFIIHIPKYRKLTLHEIMVLEINAT